MSLQQIKQIGDPILKAQNQQIIDFKSKSLKQLITDLQDTMQQMGLVGLAAPQIGQNYQVFITEPRVTKFRTLDQTDELRIYINPKIIEYSAEEITIYEGCGSVEHGQLFGPVKRPKILIIQAYNENGQKFQLKCDGLLARVIMHEYDHLSGVEFTEKISDYKQLMNAEFYIKSVKNHPEQVENLKINIKEVEEL